MFGLESYNPSCMSIERVSKFTKINYTSCVCMIIINLVCKWMYQSTESLQVFRLCCSMEGHYVYYCVSPYWWILLWLYSIRISQLSTKYIKFMLCTSTLLHTISQTQIPSSPSYVISIMNSCMALYAFWLEVRN